MKSIDLSTFALGQTVASQRHGPVTRHTLALYCGASTDYNPLHVDIDAARAAGYPDVIAHGMLVMAYLGSLLAGIAPLDAHRRFMVRFVAATQVQDVLTCTATLLAIERHGEDRRARLDLEVRAANGDLKVTGEAEIALIERGTT